MIYMALQMAFGVLASVIVAWFSRRREFRADAGGAALESPASMAGALNRLRAMRDARSQLPPGLAAVGIRGEGLNKLMATHPPARRANRPASGERLSRRQPSCRTRSVNIESASSDSTCCPS